jgi:ribosomal protein S18 acetylase RimI-like enzyme
MAAWQVRALEQQDARWVARLTGEYWGSEKVVAHGAVFYPAELPGFVAEEAGEPRGWLTYHLEGTACEIVTLASLLEGQGVASALIEALRDEARAAGCRRLWLVTTNDNTHALRFYQRRGFRLVALRPDAMAASRRLKPEIPLLGEDDIPIRDELELELTL